MPAATPRSLRALLVLAALLLLPSGARPAALGSPALPDASVHPRTENAPAARAAQPAAELHYALASLWRSGPPPPPIRARDWPEGHVPGGLGLSADGARAFVADASADLIRVYEGARPAGTLGAPGAGPGQLRRPRDVAVLPDGRLAIADGGNHRVQLWDADGTFLRSWHVDDPMAVLALPGEGRSEVWALSRIDGAVWGFDAEGGRAVGSARLDDYLAPAGLAWLGHLRSFDGQRLVEAPRFLVADPEAGTVSAITAGGPYQDRLRGRLPGVAALAAPPPGSLLLEPEAALLGQRREGLLALDAAVPPGGRLRLPEVVGLAISGTGEALATDRALGFVSLGSADHLHASLARTEGRLIGPQRIAAGDDLFLADGWSHVLAWGRDGLPRRTWDLGPPVASAEPARDVAAAGHRRYALLAGGEIARLDGAERLSAAPLRPAGEGGVVAIDARGAELAALDLLAQELVLLDEDLAERARWPLGAGFRGVSDLALGTDAVWLANRQAGTLERWSRDGQRERALPVPTGPVRVALGPEGGAFALASSGWVFAFDSEGEGRGAWPVGAAGEAPTDLALDGAGRLYVTDAADRVRVYEPAPAPERPLPAPGDERCSALPNRGRWPEEVRLGETVRVELVLEGDCPAAYQPADVVLALDRSGSMGEAGKLAAARAAAADVVAQLDPSLVRLGALAFSGRAEPLAGLAADRRELLAAILGLRAGGQTSLVAGIEGGLDLLEAGGERAGAARVLVLLSDGLHTADGVGAEPAGLDGALTRAEALGVKIYAIGLGEDADEGLLRRVAGDPQRAIHSPGAGELRAAFREIARRIEAAVLYREVRLRERLASTMDYAPGGAAPAEPAREAGGRELVWRLEDLPEPGLRVAFDVRPTALGVWPLSDGAQAEIVDGFGNEAVVDLPNLSVSVVAPAMRRAYLPLALHERCRAERLQVLLAVDASSSMDAPIRPGGPAKIAALREALLAFLERARLERDEIRLLRFDEEAREIAAGPDRAALEAAIRGLQTGRGTRMDRALALARAAVAEAAERPGTRSVVVLLTDGHPSEGTRDAALAEADRLRAAGATLYTVAVGEDADLDYLRRAAVSPARAYRADDAETLAALYREVVGDLRPCAPAWSP